MRPVDVVRRAAPPGGRPPPSPERRRYAEKARDELLGCIYLDSDANTYSFREEDLYLFLTLANHATTALLKERLYRQAITDPLTRLFTRGHFERELRGTHRAFEVNRAPYAMLFVDLDGFKAVNDTRGHLMGDAVLRDATRLIRGRSVRTTSASATAATRSRSCSGTPTWTGPGSPPARCWGRSASTPSPRGSA